jgi:glycosyltransferase involved in cell wall biosynthesis
MIMTPNARFSIVTPAFNSERYIGETIESVISQAGNFSIEYFIMDGGSTDGTREIVQRYQKLLLGNFYPIQCNEIVIHWYSEKDGGMYDAINSGFKNATGDICAYINSDDIYLPGAFNAIATVFTKYPEIEWLKGISSFMNSYSTICQVDLCHLYAQEWIAKGVYGRWLHFINQESVFWRKSLWERVNGIDRSLKLAGDYSLWIMFSKYAPLVSVKAYVSCFRYVKGQLSSNFPEYLKEMDRVCPPDRKLEKTIRLVLKIRRIARFNRLLPLWMRPYFYRTLTMIDKQKYCAVEIGINEDIHFYEGDYYTVSNNLLNKPLKLSPD